MILEVGCCFVVAGTNGAVDIERSFWWNNSLMFMAVCTLFCILFVRLSIKLGSAKFILIHMQTDSIESTWGGEWSFFSSIEQSFSCGGHNTTAHGVCKNEFIYLMVSLFMYSELIQIHLWDIHTLNFRRDLTWCEDDGACGWHCCAIFVVGALSVPNLNNNNKKLHWYFERRAPLLLTKFSAWLECLMSASVSKCSCTESEVIKSRLTVVRSAVISDHWIIIGNNGINLVTNCAPPNEKMQLNNSESIDIRQGAGQECCSRDACQDNRLQYREWCCWNRRHVKSINTRVSHWTSATIRCGDKVAG